MEFFRGTLEKLRISLGVESKNIEFLMDWSFNFHEILQGISGVELYSSGVNSYVMEVLSGECNFI